MMFRHIEQPQVEQVDEDAEEVVVKVPSKELNNSSHEGGGLSVAAE